MFEISRVDHILFVTCGVFFQLLPHRTIAVPLLAETILKVFSYKSSLIIYSD